MDQTHSDNAPAEVPAEVQQAPQLVDAEPGPVALHEALVHLGNKDAGNQRIELISAFMVEMQHHAKKHIGTLAEYEAAFTEFCTRPTK